MTDDGIGEVFADFWPLPVGRPQGLLTTLVP